MLLINRQLQKHDVGIAMFIILTSKLNIDCIRVVSNDFFRVILLLLILVLILMHGGAVG